MFLGDIQHDEPAGDGGFACARCTVRADAICGVLADEEIAALSRLGRKLRIARGQTLVIEGDASVIVGNLLSGVLKLSTMTGDGREQIVGMVFPSDFIGRPFAASSPHSVTALTDAHVCLFRSGAFDAFADAHPEIEKALLTRTLDELDRARRWLLLLGRMSAPERVASLLIEIAERLGGMNGKEIMLPLGRQQMGDLLGLAIETVSRSMTKLKRDGIIGLPGGRRLIVRDRDRLARMAGQTAPCGFGGCAAPL